MLYLLIPTLLTAGLVMWGVEQFNDDSDDDNSNDTPEPAQQITKTFDADTGLTVVRGTDGDDVYQGDSKYEQVFAGKGDDQVFGGAGRDFINLGDGNDTAAGGEGKDRLFGGAGNDTLNGGLWRDYVSGGSGNDTVMSADYYDAQSEIQGRDMRSEALSDGSSVAPELRAFMKRADVNDDGNDFIYGNEGDDFLWDVKGSNQIFGGAGNDDIGALDLKNTPDSSDVLSGGEGEDKLTGDDGDRMWGGNGKDEFNVSVMEADDKAVLIKDYERGEKISIQIDTPDGQPPALTYAFNNGEITISTASGQELVKVGTTEGQPQLAASDIEAIKAAVSVSAT